MSDDGYKRTVLLLIVMLIVFAIIFLVAFVGLQRKEAIVNITGLPVDFENWLIMILSIGSIIKVVYELYRIKKA